MTIEESFRELGLPPGSSEAEVKEAWRRLAARWHPDRNPSPQALRKIQQINGAIEQIRRWRASGLAEPQQADADAATDGAAEAAGDTGTEVVDHGITLSLEEACTGCSCELQGEVVEECGSCGGSGRRAAASECTACAGSGRVRPHLWFAWLGSGAACTACGGEGEVHAACGDCAGTGHGRPRRYRCRVEVPAGTRDGESLQVHARVPGRLRQHALRLRVSVSLAPHPFFALDADGTVRCTVPVDGFAWMAERWADIPSPRGPQQMRLRRAFVTYRLKGHGLGGADCIATIEPLFPAELDAGQQLLVDRLVAGNTGARGSAAGRRMAEWVEQVESRRRD